MLWDILASQPCKFARGFKTALVYALIGTSYLMDETSLVSYVKSSLGNRQLINEGLMLGFLAAIGLLATWIKYKIKARYALRLGEWCLQAMSSLIRDFGCVGTALCIIIGTYLMFSARRPAPGELTVRDYFIYAALYALCFTGIAFGLELSSALSRRQSQIRNSA